tara:strand:+ start:3286 stop:3651 length:366 start_codon:yes stop_codon:yes gene_type:complete
MTDTTLLYKQPELDSNPITDDLDGWIAVDGKPKATMKTWIQHTSNDGSIISGTWHATVGFWHTTYAAYEFVHLIEGRITITPDGGESQTFGPGDAFTVDVGFKGVWEIKEPVKKHFVIKIK